MEHESCSDEKSTIIVKWGTICTKLWNVNNCFHCRWKHSVTVLHSLIVFFFLNHSFPLLLKEACSTNKLAKKNNLSEKITQKNSSMLPCQRNLAIMGNQSHSPRLGKDVASPRSAASFLCDLTLATFSFGHLRKHGRSSYVSWKQRSSVFMTHSNEPSRQNTFFGVYNSKILLDNNRE